MMYASPRLRADVDVVTTAVSQCGFSLEFACAELRCNMHVCMMAVQTTSHRWNKKCNDFGETLMFFI